MKKIDIFSDSDINIVTTHLSSEIINALPKPYVVDRVTLVWPEEFHKRLIDEYAIKDGVRSPVLSFNDDGILQLFGFITVTYKKQHIEVHYK